METDSQKLGVLEGVQSTSSDDVGDSCLRCILYNTLRLNNLESFIMLQKQWEHQYSNKNDEIRELSVILPQVYEELKLKNVEMSPALQFVLENEIITSSFVTEVNRDGRVRTSLAEVMERIKMMVGHVNELVAKYMSSDKETDEEFVVTARLVCQNLHILKRKLRSTYNQLPWEEVEFILANFIVVHTRLESNVVYKFILPRRKLLTHLDNFAQELNKVKLEDTDVESKFPKLMHSHLSPRESVVKSVADKCNQFKDLHSDFQQMKDVYSLRRIEWYIDLAVTVDMERERGLGKLVIERALQVIGESLKNTVESPHVSDAVHRALLAAAPRNVREIISVLRDSLSHSHTLRKKMELEDTEDSKFFVEVQNDLQKVKAEVTVILYEQKSNIIRSFLKQSLHSNDIENFKNVISSLSTAELGELSIRGECSQETKNIRMLLALLDGALKDKTDMEIDFFKQMENLLNTHTSRRKNAQYGYLTELLSLADVVEEIEEKRDIATVLHDFDLTAGELSSFLQPQLLDKIVTLVDEFSLNCNPSARYTEIATKREIDELLYQIRSSIVFGAMRVKGIDSFKHNLEKRVSTDSRALADNEINSLVQQVEEHLELEEKLVFQQEFKNSKEKYEAKLKLSVLFAGLIDKSVTKDEYTAGRFDELKNCLGMKKLDNHFENCNWEKCKNLVDSTRNSYQTLLNSVKNAIDDERLLDIAKTFETFCKTFKNKIKLELALKKIAQIKKEQHTKHFEQRLKLLRDLLPNPCENNFQFVVSYKNDKTLQAAVEMLVLDLLEALNEVSELSDNVLRIDNYSPVLVGKSLRNYLAHGNILDEILPCDPAIAVFSNALKIVQNETLFTKCAAKTHQIGRLVTENINSLKKRVDESLKIVRNQSAIFVAATKGDIKVIQDTIIKGADIRGRDVKNWTSLHFAVAGDSLETLRLCYDQGLTTEVKDIHGQTPLHVAAVKSSRKVIGYLTEKANLNVNDSDDRNMTPIHYAAVNGCQEVMMTLLESGANVGAKTKENVTPLHFAAGKGHLVNVRILLENKANKNALNDNHMTPMHVAASYGHKDVVEYLLTKIKNVNMYSNNKITALHLAASNGHGEVVEVLIHKGAKVNAATRDGVTPLHVASGKDVICQLIKRGARVNIPTTNKHFTPLHCAASSGRVSEVAELLEKHARVDGHERCNLTPLHMAAGYGNEDMVSTLLRFKATVNAKGIDDWTPLHFAAFNGHSSVVALLLTSSANIDARTSSMQTPLHLAALQGHRSTVEALVGGKADTCAVDKDGMTPLHYVGGFGYADLVTVLLTKTNIDIEDGSADTALSLAAGQGHKDVVDILLSLKAYVGVGAGSKTKWTPLHYAAGNGHTYIVERLCSHEADVNALTNMRVTPLHLAAQHWNKDCVEILLKAGAMVDVLTDYSWTALHYAANSGHKEIVEVLLAYKADVNAADDEGMTALHLSVQLGFRDVMEALLKRGAHVDACSSDGETSLHLASLHDHTDIMEVLLNSGAGINMLTEAKWTPLHFSANDNRKQAVKLLLARQADPNVPTTSLCTPLHMASCNGHLEVINELLKYDALMDLPNCVGWTPLYEAVRKGFDRIVTTLLNKGAQVNISDIGGITPLHYAGRFGYLFIVDSLIAQGAKIDAQDKCSDTPLHYAAIYGQACVIHALLERGAQSDAKNKDRYSAMDLAAMNGHLDAVIALLERNVDILEVSDNGTVLHHAARGSNEMVVRLFLDRASDLETHQFVNATDSDGDTCLVSAILQGNTNVVRLLIESGVDIDAQNIYNMTALHWAVQENNLEIVKLLIDRKANKNIQRLDGKTALDVAKELGHLEIASFLEPHPEIIQLFRRFVQTFVSCMWRWYR